MLTEAKINIENEYKIIDKIEKSFKTGHINEEE